MIMQFWLDPLFISNMAWMIAFLIFGIVFVKLARGREVTIVRVEYPGSTEKEYSCVEHSDGLLHLVFLRY